MNGLPYYKAFPRDFFEGTVGMPFELKGVYRLLLDLIYMHGGKLVDDPRFISGHLGCSVRAWNIAREKLISDGKIYADLGIISNFRADKELESLRKFQDKQRENATKSNKNNNIAKATAKPKRRHTEPEPDIDTVSNDTVSPEPENSAPVCVAIPVTTGQDVSIFESEVDEWSKAFPAVDVRQQLLAMRAWVIANPTKRKTPRGVRRFIVSWLDREQNRGGQRSPVPRQAQPPPIREDGFTKALREDMERSRAQRHEPTTINGNGYDDTRDAGPNQSGARIIELAASSFRRE